MSLTTDHPLLVAPRPVRLGATAGTRAQAHAHDLIPSDSGPRTQAHAHDSAPKDHLKSTDKDVLDPRSSPRSPSFASLPTEALEEFLSILRPSIFPPLSPVSRRAARDRGDLWEGQALGRLLADLVPDDIDIPRSQQPSRNCRTPDSINEDSHIDPPFRWCKSNVLCKPPLFPHLRSLSTFHPASPISRTHTRNPFLRHASNRSPVMISPAAIPLPQPTPDEMVDMS